MNIATNQIVAIKCFKEQIFGLENNNENYLNEAKILGILQHRNIIELIEIIDEMQTCLIFPYVQSNLFSELYEQTYSYSRQRTTAVMEMLLSAISHMHSLQIIHRDLKPSNILVDGGGSIKVCDFGLATSTRFYQFDICGTRAYMAPEIFIKIGYNQKVYIWVSETKYLIHVH